MPKDPMLVDKVVLANGGDIETQAGTAIVSVDSSGAVTITGTTPPTDITLAHNKLLVGQSTNLAGAVAQSGDSSVSDTGVSTVVSAAAAFNVGTNETFTKEVDHTITVADSTTANTAGGALSKAAGKSTGTAVGGVLSLKSGASSNGTAVNPGASGAVTLAAGTPGTATTGTAGDAGIVTVGGTAGGASTGASSTAGAGTHVHVFGGAGGNSSGGSDTGGRGGNVDITPGTGGTGAIAGVDGMAFVRGTLGKKFTVTAMTTSATISVAALRGGMITANQGGAGAATYTMPTGTVMAAALPATFTTGDSFDFTIINISTVDAEDVTLAGASGMTAVGNLFVEANSSTAKIASAQFRVLCTGASAYSVYRIS